MDSILIMILCLVKVCRIKKKFAEVFDVMKSKGRPMKNELNTKIIRLDG